MILLAVVVYETRGSDTKRRRGAKGEVGEG
jgi:hypothetical protein